MARVKGPAKGALVISNTDKNEFLMAPLEVIPMSQADFDAVVAGTKKIKIQPVREAGFLRFELKAVE